MLTPSQQMLNAAQAGYQSLNSEAAEKLRAFILSRIDADGGFMGLDNRPDLYYTVFGIECMLAAGMDTAPAHIERFLSMSNSDVSEELLAFASRSRLVCRAGSSCDWQVARLVEQIEGFRRNDGGYADSVSCFNGSVYAGFLATLAYSDLNKEMPVSEKLVDFVLGRQTPGGGLINRSSESKPCTTSTSAGIVILNHFGESASIHSDWLQELACEEGGFQLSAESIGPDLISTAVAVHALSRVSAGHGQSLKHARFVQSFWHAEGGFCSVPADGPPDCEHTFYGLMALGDLVNG